MRRVVVLLILVLTMGCTGGGEPTTTTTAPPATTQVPVTTSTVPERCPDVFCVVYHIAEDAFWSDGSPVVAGDFVHTLGLARDPLGSDSGNPGYSLISGHQVLDEKTVQFAFSQPYGAWRTLFDVVLPAHADPGEPGPSSGPFALREWVVGDRIVLERNRWHSLADQGADQAAEIWFTYPDGIRGMIGGLRSGDLDLANPRPVDWAVADLDAIDGVTRQVAPGPFWEQVTFNLDDPLLSQRWAREVIALAIDREAVLDVTVRSVYPTAEPLGSAFYMQGADHYEDNYPFEYDPEQAEQILADQACERGDDDVQVCQGRRMSFVWATTAGDEWREAQLAMAVESLAAIGVEIVPRPMIPSGMFSRQFFFADSEGWQLMSFSWRASVDPYLFEQVLRCEGNGPHGMGELNVGRFCHAGVEVALDAAGSSLDPDERARAYAEADQVFLGELAVIPLYQKPVLLAWDSDLRGPQANPAGTDMWNVGEWAGLGVVTVALGGEPSQVVGLGPLDDAGAMVRDALYLGAFRVDPRWRFEPELVSSAEAFLRGR